MVVRGFGSPAGFALPAGCARMLVRAFRLALTVAVMNTFFEKTAKLLMCILGLVYSVLGWLLSMLILGSSALFYLTARLLRNGWYRLQGGLQRARRRLSQRC